MRFSSFPEAHQSFLKGDQSKVVNAKYWKAICQILESRLLSQSLSSTETVLNYKEISPVPYNRERCLICKVLLKES